MTDKYAFNVSASNESMEKIIPITGIYDLDLIQQSFKNTNFDIDLTMENLLKVATEDNAKSNRDRSRKQIKTKRQLLSNQQIKINKKNEHREQILAKNRIMKQVEEKLDTSINDEQEYVPPANMEFINI